MQPSFQQLHPEANTLIDDKRLQVGYKEDDIRAFLPRSIRNVENSQARMRAAL